MVAAAGEHGRASRSRSRGRLGVEGECAIKLTWEEDFARELQEAMAADNGAQCSTRQPLLVAIAGIPGAGKTTSAAALGKLLGPSCLVLPMDGFHLSMAELRARPDAPEAIYRRGAPDTFNPAALRAALLAMRDPDAAKEVAFPGFDHAVGDPTPDAYRFVRERHRLVLVEGLYLLHDEGDWAGIPELFGRSIFIESDVDAAIERIKIRNRCLPGYTPEEIDVRCEKVDRSNAMIVKRSMKNAARVVKGCT